MAVLRKRRATPARPVQKIPTKANAPSKAGKLIYISDKLGLDGIKEMQGSTVNIVDTVALITGADRQVLTFFAQSGKSRNFSNFQNGSLRAGEAMVIEELAFILLVTTNADLTSNANAILFAMPLSQATAAQLPNFAGINVGSLINMKIANSQIVKDYNAFEMIPSFNPGAAGLTTLDSATATNRVIGPDKIKLEAPSVLPPNQSISVTLEIPPTGTVPAFTHIMCVAGRFGSIFAGKITY